MRAGSGPKPVVIALVAVVVAVIAYWGFRTYQKHALDATIVASIQDASQRVHSALTLAAGPYKAVTLKAAERIATDADEVDRRLQALRNAGPASDMTLVDAADGYLLTVREVLKRVADSHKQRLMLADSTQALRNHMRADNRTGAWVTQAVRGKERMDNDFRGFRNNTEAVDTLLATFPESQKKVARYVGAGAFIDDKLLADVRRRANEELKRVTAEHEAFASPRRR